MVKFLPYNYRYIEDKVCNGYFTSDQLNFCAKYKVEPCLMMAQCYSQCGEIDCWRGEEKHPFHSLVVPKNITTDNAKNLCVFYNSKLCSLNMLQALTRTGAMGARYMWTSTSSRAAHRHLSRSKNLSFP